MSSNIPACGIDAYMQEEAWKQLPPNRVWLLLQWLKLTKVVWLTLLVLCVVGIMLYDLHHGTTFLARAMKETSLDRFLTAFVDGIFTVAASSYMLWIMVSIFARHPGVWHRYSRKAFAKRYGRVYKPLSVAEGVILAVRKENPGAEFELAVLERPFTDLNTAPDRFGFVLFQVAEKNEQPLLVLDGRGDQQQFGEAYAPFGYQAKSA